MDANGGCGLVPSTSQSVYQTPNQALHYFLYNNKLWLVKCIYHKNRTYFSSDVCRNTFSIHVGSSTSRISSEHW